MAWDLQANAPSQLEPENKCSKLFQTNLNKLNTCCTVVPLQGGAPEMSAAMRARMSGGPKGRTVE
eukprot:9311229-Alexandrium_andersonii.AAC.1